MSEYFNNSEREWNTAKEEMLNKSFATSMIKRKRNSTKQIAKRLQIKRRLLGWTGSGRCPRAPNYKANLLRATLFKVDEREINSGDGVRLFNRERARVTSVSHALHVIKPTEPI